MTNRINIEDWLVSEEMGGQDWIAGGQAPTAQPGGPGDPMGQKLSATTPPDPSVTAPPKDPMYQPQDVNQDPMYPDMPDDATEDDDQDFEVWKREFLKESIKGNSNQMIDLIHKVRNRDLDPIQRKFVEDNLQIQFIRQQPPVVEASKEIRRLINDQYDRNNPSTSLVHHLFTSLQKQRLLCDIFIKLTGYYGLKGELHRKYIASLLGAVQVSTGNENEDLILDDNEFATYISTRMNSVWGMVKLLPWALKEGESERFLSDSEQKKLTSGSPEERDAMRHRVIIESVVNRFKNRAFIVTVVLQDGTIQNMGIDLGTTLKTAYLSGKLVVRTRRSADSEVMLSSDGDMIPYLDLDIKYQKQTGEVDDSGNPHKREVDFIERRNGYLYLVASQDVLKEAMSSLQGIAITTLPYTGNPSDIRNLTRCTDSVSNMLMRQC